MKISDELRLMTKNLIHRRINNPALDAEILLSHVLKKSREYLLAHPEIKLTPSQNKKYRALIARRGRGEPLAYLTHCQEFYGLNFYVDKNTLIPRPESELIVEEIKKIAAPNQKPIIIDVGAGSGCLAITLSKTFPTAHIYATDISPKALIIARKNARHHKAKIKFYRGNLLASLPASLWSARAATAPIYIIANLPYLSKKYRKNLRGTSLKFEPKIALWGGCDGLKYYRELFFQIHQQ
ncbi:MAG: peptide chain release factor N(5)-glutamine methyltransferase, partial [bacterium]|nr:peptide chain release factor N(5)-glutamine methyltransferase [bacterium]